jgi:primary-amine oxidase
MSVTVAVTHPLDPLTAEEISAAVGAVRAAQPLERPTFSLVVLQDPPKAEVVGFAPGDPIARRARVVVTDRATHRTFEGIVDLARRELASWVELEGIMPPIVEEDFICAAAAALADERFVAALRRRGIEDLGQVQVDPLAAGSFPQNPPGRRIVWATPYLKPHPLANAYSSPIEHLRASVDLDTGEVIDVLDHDPIVPISTADGDYETEEAVGGWRDDVAPLEIVQPEGPGFTIEGHVLRWQDWRLHVAPHPVDGLVLSDLRFRDGDEERQVLYRASLSEMVVPYGDPHDGFYWRTYFDGGEYGMGRLANSLELGCDCLGEIRYLDSVVPDAAGQPRTITNAVCIREEDAGVLW